MSTVKSTSPGNGISIATFTVLAIDSKVKSIYLFVSLSYDSFSHCFLYDKETKDKYTGLTFQLIACNSTN